MDRAFPNIMVANVAQAASFYEELLGMTRHFDSDWFVILTHPNLNGLEFGLLQRSNDIIPGSQQAAPQGVMMTFVVKDVNEVYETAKRINATIIEAPTDMPYGQRRMLVKDLDGTLMDVSSPTAPRPAE